MASIVHTNVPMAPDTKKLNSKLTPGRRVALKLIEPIAKCNEWNWLSRYFNTYFRQLAIYSQDGCSTGTVAVFGLGKEERGVLMVGNGQNRDSQYCDGQDPDGRVPEEQAAQLDRPALGLAH